MCISFFFNVSSRVQYNIRTNKFIYKKWDLKIIMCNNIKRESTTNGTRRPNGLLWHAKAEVNLTNQDTCCSSTEQHHQNNHNSLTAVPSCKSPHFWYYQKFDIQYFISDNFIYNFPTERSNKDHLRRFQLFYKFSYIIC